MSLAGTKFKTCFHGTDYFHIAANPSGGIKLIPSSSQPISWSLTPSVIHGIGCNGAKFFIFYSIGPNLYRLTYDTGLTYTESDILYATSFVDIHLADNNYPAEFTWMMTYADGNGAQCQFYNLHGAALSISTNLTTDICIPIESVAASSYQYALLQTDIQTCEVGTIDNAFSSNLPLYTTPPDLQESFLYNGDYYLTGLSSGLYEQIYLGNAQDKETVSGVASRSSLILQSDVAQYDGVLISLLVLQSGSMSFMAKYQLTSTTIPQIMDGVLGLTATSLIDVVQLNSTTFRLYFVNGTELNTVDFLLTGDIFSSNTPIVNIPQSLPAPPTPPLSPSTPLSPTPLTDPPIVVVSVNSSVTVEDLNLNQTTVLVISNEAVVTVTNCASLAGTLKYVLSQPQYEELIANNTLDVLVLLTQCANGSFDAIEIVAENNQDDCLTFTGKPNKDPAQLTLLITTQQSVDCGQVIDEPLLPIGAIIGIVVGCAGAVTLIIVLALYFSPVREKVFPYANRNAR